MALLTARVMDPLIFLSGLWIRNPELRIRNPKANLWIHCDPDPTLEIFVAIKYVKY
jgi:hypothetical protein